MSDQRPTSGNETEERLRRRRGALAGAVLVIIFAVLLAGMSANFHIDVGTTVTGPVTATQPVGGLTTYNYHVGVIQHPRRWFQLLVFVVTAILLCAIYANYRRSDRKP